MDIAEKETTESLNVNPRAQAPSQGDSSPEGDLTEESSLNPRKPGSSCTDPRPALLVSFLCSEFVISTDFET